MTIGIWIANRRRRWERRLARLADYLTHTEPYEPGDNTGPTLEKGQ